MTRPTSAAAVPRAQKVTERALNALEHFLHIESVSGIILLLAAATALIWANSPFAESYQHFWHSPLSIGFGNFQIVQPLHFWINDALMTVFFLVAGMEIRRESHDGALSSVKEASLPIAAALGGVIVPALIYLSINHTASVQPGWAIPTATDIAFAVGVLALLGKSIPATVRIFLLALAIIDDIIAVLIIALFYSEGLDTSGLWIVGIGILLTIIMQQMGISSAHAFILPGALLWFGLLKTGAHPTLAGVVLGLMTPVVSRPAEEGPIDRAFSAIREFSRRRSHSVTDVHALMQPVKQLRQAQRELLPPVVRVQMALHPWVAYGIMPLFALANAGVSFDGIALGDADPQRVMLGITLALVLGKPIGILAASALVIRLGWCRMPAAMNWMWLVLIGILAGIGFTMSIFIAMLAFTDTALLSAAKLGVLIASVSAGVIGLLFGFSLTKRHSGNQSVQQN